MDRRLQEGRFPEQICGSEEGLCSQTWTRVLHRLTEPDRKEPTMMSIAVVIVMVELGHWHSRCPSLPGCGAIGQSRQDALRNIDLAIRGYLASLDVAFPPELNLAISPV